MSYKCQQIVVAIPCYNVKEHILDVLSSIPNFVDKVILVNDTSTDLSPENFDLLVKESGLNESLIIIHHEVNQGVGGSMITAYTASIKAGMDITVKIDGDGQMDASQIEKLLDTVCDYRLAADFAKGNRFAELKALQKMPIIRRIGNFGLSFLVKFSSGYWRIFDPTNGFLVIRNETLKKLDLTRLHKRYFFECSQLIELYYSGATVCDVPMPALYGEEKSHLSIWKALFIFPYKLFRAYIRRIMLTYFVYDFSIYSLYLATSIPLMLFGLVFGIIKWINFAQIGISAPTGTVMLSVLPVILGFQLFLSFMQFDISRENPFKSHITVN